MPLPHERPFRFGAALHVPGTRDQWLDKCRKAEALGYDTISVPDHLGMPGPFPTIMLAAEVTERVRLGTYMLNANFYRPALLAREIATTDLLIGGRLEVGIGAGHAKPEFELAGLPYGSGRDRVEGLGRMVSELRVLFTHPDMQPQPAQRPSPPMMIAGRGDRLLTLAAREADIIGFNGAASSQHDKGGLPTFAAFDAVAERVDFARSALGERIGEVEFNSAVVAVIVTNDRRSGLEKVEQFAPHLSLEERAEVPGLLVGTVQEIADKLRKNRERLGFSYITVLEPGLEAMAPVIELLRGQ
uniref:LLM class F420-dependent oxidoreductase n=1 Tax=Nonomuraea sp. CA-252377 TaxID=3240003 RepID=UPI003F490F1D